jgi:DNA-binding response OmpR family regulator
MKKKILLIEDEKSVSKAYGEHLQNEGYEMEYAYDGEEGLEKIRSFKPDLVLLDLLLPKLDGVSVINEIKADDDIKDTPILVLTNLSTGESIANAVKSGITTYLVKSVHSLEDVSSRIKDLL